MSKMNLGIRMLLVGVALLLFLSSTNIIVETEGKKRLLRGGSEGYYAQLAGLRYADGGGEAAFSSGFLARAGGPQAGVGPQAGRVGDGFDYDFEFER